MSILFDNPPPAIGCGDPGDPIEFACLFNGSSAAPAYLRRAPSDALPSYKIAISVWSKAVSVGGFVGPFVTAGLSPAASQWVGSNSIGRGDGGTTNTASIAERHRDPSGWAHYLIKADVTAETPLADRAAFAANGVAFPLATNLMDDSVALRLLDPQYWQAIGANVSSTGDLISSSQSVCLAEFVAITGDAVDAVSAADFGYFNSDGNFVPKTFIGKGFGSAVYGANGFHLDFADPLDLGKDVSGNGNHFTANGLTVDNLVTDTPGKNCTTLNPLYVDSAKITPTNGNLTAIGNASNPAANNVAGTHIIRHKAFFAMTPVTLGNGSFYIGLQTADGLTYCYRQDGATVLAGAVSAYGAAFAVGDWVGCGYDPATGDIEFFKLIGGAWVSQGILPAAISAADVLPWVYASHQTRVDVNFGQRAWPAQLPDGYADHSTSSMRCPPILNPNDYFTHRVKTGGASVSDLPFNPTVHKALVVSKCIDADEPCVVTDTVNGAGFAWETSSAVNGITARPQGLIAFTANGYTIGSDTAYQGNRLDLIWRASPRAGFDIVTVDHTTGMPTTVPQLSGGVIEYGWVVRNNAGQTRRMFHHLLGNDRYFPMNAAGGPVTDTGWFSSTANTVTLGASLPTGIYTLYVWRSVPQFSSFGRYAPNDSNNGPFLPLDFLPRLFQPNGGGPNGTRSIFVDDLVVNGGNDPRLAFEAAAEAVTAYEYCDFLSNGVKARGVYTPINYSDTDYYYPAAWARTPGKFARAR
ncbi:MAG: hypothetical protein GYB52_06880 [Rhodospirillales bacterium]|nr:hypothetical protein [Rhodospirillales bacterium]MBR9816338.1 hypothetical protein [Rhodospirillales bacterium]